MESITSFFRRQDFEYSVRGSSLDTAFWGKLDRALVQSEKRVIVYEYPRVLMKSDTVGEAIDYLLSQQRAGRNPLAAIYEHEHNTRLWRRIGPTLT